MGRVPGLRRRGFDCTVAQAPRLVEPAEQQSGAIQRVVVPAATRNESPRGEALDELLAFPEPVQCLARLAVLRRTRAEDARASGSKLTTFPVLSTAIHCSASERAFAQSP